MDNYYFKFQDLYNEPLYLVYLYKLHSFMSYFEATSAVNVHIILHIVDIDFLDLHTLLIDTIFDKTVLILIM